MAKWMEIRKGADFQAVSEKFRITPFTARLIRNKDITEDEAIREYLHGDLSDLHAASLMKGIPEAVLYERKPLSLAQVEKAVGKKEFESFVGGMVIRMPGKPTLVEESDKRPAVTN